MFKFKKYGTLVEEDNERGEFYTSKLLPSVEEKQNE